MAWSKNWLSSFIALLIVNGSVLADAPLHLAVHADRTNEALRLLAKGASAKEANRYGVRPLLLACQNGNAQLVNALLIAGADANHHGNGGHTPLMTAARTGKLDPVKLLLEAGAEVNHQDRQGQTALMWAAVEGHAGVVRLLLEQGAERDVALRSGFTAWFFAARQGHGDVLAALLDHGAAINAGMENEGGGGRRPKRGTSALILALENGHFEVAAQLVKAGADPNDQRTGYGPLHVLTWVRKPVRGDGIDGAPPPRGTGSLTSLDLAETLISHGGRVNEPLRRGSTNGSRLGSKGATPFLLAARTADLPYMKWLLDHGADFRLANAQGRTPLLAAAGVALGPEADEAATEDEAVAAVRFLLDLGANLHHIDDEGDTIMHAAAYKQSPKLVQVIDDAEADIAVWNRKNARGWTPLLIAQGFRHGNFKPSAPTIAALSEVMRRHGVEPPPSPPPPSQNSRKREGYQTN